MSMRLKIWLALGAVYIIWGSTYLAIRFAVETIPPFLMVGTRFLVAGAILYGFRRLRGDAPPQRVEWKAAAVVGILLLVGGNGIVVWAEQYIPSGITALIVGTAPVFMVLIDALRPGAQRPGSKRALGILIGFAGIVILVNPSGMAQDPDRWVMIGLGALFLATFFWALGSLYNRNARLPESPLMGTGMEMLVGGGCLLVIATLNLRLKFSPSNASYHPVEAVGKNREVPSLIIPYSPSSRISCTDCHASDSGGRTDDFNGPHGSMWEPILERQLITSDFTAESARAYALCYKCHNRSSILSDNSFSLHRKLVVDEKAPCTACHDSHGVEQNTHLLNFDKTIVSPNDRGELRYQDLGRFRGACYLKCHAVNHDPKIYP